MATKAAPHTAPSSRSAMRAHSASATMSTAHKKGTALPSSTYPAPGTPSPRGRQPAARSSKRTKAAASASSKSRTSRRSPSAAGLRIRATSSARPTAPKARLPASAVSSRVINRPSLPNSSGWPTQAANQPTPTAATVPAAAHSPPHSGARRGAGQGCSDCTGCCCWRRSSTRRSGTNRLHRATVRAKPSTTAAAKAKRSIDQTLHFAK